ncbi:FAD-dependent monooxygenase [Neoehrlichia mikurensis]|uniref:FAD-dependent monooxygenase n=1 Tax=Neoehrlichia mikurensis TaxID=89586 RepID=A0A9Q9BTM7_9RICK|nr:FAD-dependent monooxygenase [Neoehrlichia mikurensis]QXK92328.1 FAD-dependent monooxygenase [Neoehrlichia mikurensis]QXK92782.1 FAD-dependent monooxygenase [Neoehrlichia mikurensis]QXK94023.1 FAD-dependent monooxygenase [Neoehrlichia mikurensis]UTO55812.1 FAD-dependent monooxygenase [Neoehrlichia mikurensis]UTO56727.1 FAD-dependent monooxygenase [Neoehrlichia mikurensis]
MSSHLHYSVIVLGGGVNGIIAGIGLTQKGISTAIIDTNSCLLSTIGNKVFALSKKSQEILQNINIWKDIKKYCPVHDILIYDSDSPISIHYNDKIVHQNSMGYIVEGNHLASILKKHLEKLDIYTSTIYQSISVKEDFAEIILNNKKSLRASLIVCAEGKNSRMRTLLKIPTIEYDFQQSCIVCNISHKNNHNNTAIEYFLPNGPLAILPMDNYNTSSIAWTEKSNIVKMLTKLSKEDFEIVLQKKCKNYLKDIKLKSNILSYPVFLTFAKKMYKNRTILIGDAAHCIHPIAGQGLNLGLRDIDRLISNIESAIINGIDIGSDYILQNICRDRYFDNFSMTFATTGLNAIFSNKSCIIKIIRNIGMFSIENSPILKKILIKHAMGIGILN